MDGILAILPFEALVVSVSRPGKKKVERPYPEGLTYLGDMYPISYYQSITTLSSGEDTEVKGETWGKNLSHCRSGV